jgi:hypothetical protein
MLLLLFRYISTQLNFSENKGKKPYLVRYNKIVNLDVLYECWGIKAQIIHLI